MSEKRFGLYSDDYFFGAYDKVAQEKIGVLGSIDLLNSLLEENEQLKKEKMELEKKLECCEYEHFTNELDKLHEKIDKGDYSDFKQLKQEEKDKQIEEDYARLQRRKILERSGNCKPLTLKYNPNKMRN